MSTSLDLRVSDALQLIAERVRKRGMDHPEGLTVSLPFENGGEVIVTAHVYIDEPSPRPLKTIYDGKL